MCDKRATMAAGSAQPGTGRQIKDDPDLLPMENRLGISLVDVILALLAALAVLCALVWVIQQSPVPESLAEMMANITTIY